MSRNSVLLVTCLAAALMFTALSGAQASPARVAGLNLAGPGTGFVRDYVNTYPYPVAITRYPDLMWAHLGGTTGGFEADHRIMGMFKQLGEDGAYGVLGITLRQNSPMDPLLQYMGHRGASDQQFDVIYGKDMERMSFGLRFDLAHSSYEDSSGTRRSPDELFPVGLGGYVNTWGLGAAIDADLGDNSMLEVGGELRFYTFEDEFIEVNDDGSVSFRLNARIFYDWAQDKTLIPLLSYNRTKVGEEDVAAGTTTTDKMDDLLLGMAVNQVVNRDDLIIYGFAFRMMGREISNDAVLLDVNDTHLPTLFMAAEHRFKDWLVGRGGASQAMVWRSYGDDDPNYPDESMMESEFNFALGLGFEWANFTIDTTLNQNFPFTGPHFISGTPTDDLFGQVSFTYTY